MTTQKMEKAYMAFKVARDARDAAQREYDEAWAVYSELANTNEADDDDAENRRIGGTR